MKKLLMLLAVIAFASPAAAQLVITGVVDADLSGGLPKAVELFACDDIADLSIYGIGSASNGGGSDGVEYVFPADFIPGGTFIYMTTDNVPFLTWFGFEADYVDSYSISINGDDALELFLVDAMGEPIEVVDTFGDINVLGDYEPWDYTDSWAKRSPATGPDGGTFELSSWYFGGRSAMDGCTDNATCANPFPVGGFYCNPTVSTEDVSFDSIKSLYR